MDGQKFYSWWFEPLVRLLEVVSKANSIEEVRAHLSKVTGPLAHRYSEADMIADCEVLGDYLGKTLIWNMDGASYHKCVDDNYVPVHGPGGLYGPYHAYDCKDDPKRGWKRETCLNWLGSSVPEDRAALEALPLGELRQS